MDEESKEEARLLASLAGAKKKAHQNALGPGLAAIKGGSTVVGAPSGAAAPYQPRTSTGPPTTTAVGGPSGTTTSYQPRTSTGPPPPAPYQPRTSTGPTPPATYQPRTSTGLTSATSGTYQPRSSTGGGPTPATGGTHQPRASTGTMPTWKLQQLEKEKREQDRLAEEEKKRKEKLQMSGGVVEESVVTLGGPPQYQNLTTPDVAGGAGGARGGGEIDSTSVAKESDYETQLKLEEERLMKKTVNTAPVGSKGEIKRGNSQLEIGMGRKVKVSWIEHGTKKPITSHEWYCTQDRLPLKAIMHEWNIKNLVWADLDQPIELQPDGFSDVTFTGIPHISVYADPV